MSLARIRVNVAAGMFSHEKVVSFRVGTTKYSLILNSEQIQGSTICVGVINYDERGALVELPAETLTYGRRVRVPLDLLEAHDTLRSRNPSCAKEWAN